MLFALKALDKATGQTVVDRIDAPSAEAAAEAARQRGLDVLEVTPLSDLPASPVLEYHTPVGDPVTYKTRLKFLLGMLSIELVVCLGLVLLAVFSSGGLGFATLIAAGAFVTIQAGILAPVVRPRAGVGPGKSPWYWLSAIAFGFVLGLVVMSLLFLAADFYWATHREFSDEHHGTVVLVAAFLALFSWLASIPLIVVFMRRGRPDSVMVRLAAALFLGSAIEFIAGIPIAVLANRRESCFCANASFWSIVISVMTGFIVLGPMVLLLIFARRTRAFSRGLCPVCNFDLRHLANRDRCPQCGAGWKSSQAG